MKNKPLTIATVAMILAIACTMVVSAQRRTTRPATPTPTPTAPSSVRKVVVKLKDGRSLDADFLQASTERLEVRVAGNILKIAMDEVAAIIVSGEAIAEAAAPATPTTLAIEAGIIYKSGGNQPVARIEFRLLDVDFASLLSAGGLPPDPNLDPIATWGAKTRYPSEDPVLLRINEGIKQHTTQSAITDFNGKAEFTDIKPGKYFIFARAQTRGGFAIWDLPIEIKGGRNSVLLDQNNAAVSF